MADEQLQFENLLVNLMSTDNQVRSQAEVHLKACWEQAVAEGIYMEAYESIPPNNKIPFLVKGMCNAQGSLEMRTMAAVLLRRLYTASFEEIWPNFTPEEQASIKHEMIACIQQESTLNMKKKMCECTAEFARNMLDDDGNNTWPEVLRFLFDWASSGDSGLRECALHVFSIVPGIFGSQQNQYVDVIKQMLLQCLNDQANKNVRYAAVKATVAFVLTNEKDTAVLSHFKDLLPAILKGVGDTITEQEDDALLKLLIELAENTPKFLRPQLDVIIELCMKVIGNTDLMDSWRQLALEVLVTLAETAPAMLRKAAGKFLGLLVQQILAMMVELEDDPEWAVSEEVDEEDNDSNSIAGESALDRIACGLGGKTMLPHIISSIPPMMANSDWKYKHAALMAISASGEGCHKQMENILSNIVEGVLPFLQDAHPRVRYAACNALGQMATDFAPIFQKKFHNKVVPGLLMAMEDNANPRVQAHAGAALVNFSEDCPKGILIVYLNAIIEKLEQVLTAKFKELLEKGSKLVLEQVVTTLASVADTAEEKFVQYYDRFMPCLKYMVQNAVSPELRLLRGKTIECISLIGLAVGREKFMADCSEVMQLLLKTQTDWEDLPEDDPQLSYMISAWARMCKIMGKEFEQYLPLVMGPVLKAAAIKPEVALLDSEDIKVLETDQDWQFVTLGDQQSFGIRTSGLEEKATACQMLVCYARELKEGFAEYTEQVVKLMVTHLKFYFHDGVRIAAAESLPFLLECARIRGDQYVNDMWHYICPELMKAVETEPEQEVKSEHMHSLGKCVEQMGKGCLTEKQLEEMVGILKKTMEEHFKRQMTREEQRKDEDYDEVVEEALIDEDDEDVYLLSKVSDFMHSLFGAYKETILPVFDQLLPNFVALLAADRPWGDRQWSLCIFDDLLEHAGPHSVRYQQYFLQPMLTSLHDKQAEIRQAASFGIGVMAQFGGPGYVQALAQATPSLLQMIQEPESRTVENLSATENAISAVTKICMYQPTSIDVDAILPHWLSWLPVWDDEDEAVHIYNYLCDLIEMNNPLILGPNNQNLPRILAIIAEAFIKEALTKDEATPKRLVNIIKQVQTNGDLFNACMVQLSDQQQTVLTALLS